ncbi:NHL repeat-containing protein [Litoreibacter arenae]|nr:hypothetical protein [Litoreibacter arenae]
MRSLLALLLTTTQAIAGLTFQSSFAIEGPTGLAFDGRRCGLWVAHEETYLSFVDLAGDLQATYPVPMRVDDVAINGEQLLATDGAGSFIALGRDGSVLSAPFQLNPLVRDSDGLHIDQKAGLVWVADDNPSALVALRSDGTMLRRIEGMALNPQMREPQGIVTDLVSGSILAADDSQGLNAIFEFTAQGALIALYDISAIATDPEGLALADDSRTLYVAFDTGDMIAQFDYAASDGTGAPPPDEGTPACN